MRKIVLGFFIITFLFLVFNSVYSACDYKLGDKKVYCPDDKYKVGEGKYEDCPGPGGLVPCGRICDDPKTPECECKPCELCDFFVMIDRIIDFLLFDIVPPLAVLMIAIGGGMYIFAPLSSPETLVGGTKGGPKMLSQAKKLLTSVVFGLLLIYGAWIFVNTFFVLIGLSEFGLKLTGPDKWFIINCP